MRARRDKRLQVVMTAAEMDALRRLAAERKVTVARLVRGWLARELNPVAVPLRARRP